MSMDLLKYIIIGTFAIFAVIIIAYLNYLSIEKAVTTKWRDVTAQ